MNPAIPCLPCLPDRQAAGREHIEEAKRYLSNAREILKSKGGNGAPGYYSDAKYVKMACHTAWCGVLVAMDTKIPQLPKGKRKTVDTYKQYLATRNRKALNDFVEAYNHLHLFGGYDGTLIRKTIHTGIQLAQNIINWCEKN
ncbi:MAG: DUF5618 family protein [Bacteroidetes bacterium]|nr:DUF5618 family protein [Bacteroidota bacterium]